MLLKDDVLSGNFSNIENVIDTDGDGLYDLEEVNWDLYDGEKTYSDYADKSYTKSDKPKKGIEQLFDGEVVETVSFVPFISDIEEIDTDNDGLSDIEETEDTDTNPRKADTDGDGLSDGLEVDLWYDPLDVNPDNDSFDDKTEYENDTDPYVYDYTIGESSVELLKGALLGDFDIPDTIPGLTGQIAASFIPFVADLRDYFANILVNEDTGAAILNVAGFTTDFFVVAGISVDALKTIPKVGKFVTKFADDAAKVLEAIRNVSKQIPEFNKFMPELAHALPGSTVNRIGESVKNTQNLTFSKYDQGLGLLKTAGKNTDEIIKETKFKTFKALKNHLGDPGKDRQWHHIVEQCQSKASRSGFDKKNINSVMNVKSTPDEVHIEISSFYSSKQGFTNDKTVRDWLNGKSFEEQYKYGLEQWEKFMKLNGYSID